MTLPPRRASPRQRQRQNQKAQAKYRRKRRPSCDRLGQPCDSISKSRPDVYEELQGHSNDMFYSSSGMLLVKTLHHAYDALKWSLYRKGDTYYVHFFNPEDITYKRLNGKAIPPSRFRYHEGPDPVLVAWHYRQTIRARIRGFSVGMKRR
ncbi:hypothetical protein EHS25_003982 [Saitozyma podzolica]|uniref:HNH nuclease domain-containing protein n=1 Tax=Saitozyma podzolica TaxID=1890683 RepID=A0A427YSX4_9TREE|nr:hypothetical protein EHS25_003982 [Saitozyma podzolica]